MRFLKIFILTSFFFPLSPTINAQYALDVKTTLEEKDNLQVYKQGVLMAISNSSWASVKDVGEDYSLWITDLRHTYEGEFVNVSIGIELRSPAMFSRGKPIAGKEISIKYNLKKADSLSLEDFKDFDFDTKDHISVEENIQAIGDLVGIAASIESVSIGSLPAQSITDIFTFLSGTLKRNPSPIEAMESYYFGELVLEATRNIIIDLKSD